MQLLEESSRPELRAWWEARANGEYHDPAAKRWMNKAVTQVYRYRPTSVFDAPYLGPAVRADSPHKLQAKQHHQHHLHHLWPEHARDDRERMVTQVAQVERLDELAKVSAREGHLCTL